MRSFFEEEFKKHERALFLVALSYLHDTEDARDAVQEAALAAFRSIGRLRQPEYFRTWMTRIVINTSKNFLKKRRPTEELTDSLAVFTAVPTEELEIMDAICRMDPALSIYISLRFYNDMSYEEAAKALRQSVSTVKYRTGRALRELKTLLEGDVSE